MEVQGQEAVCVHQRRVRGRHVRAGLRLCGQTQKHSSKHPHTARQPQERTIQVISLVTGAVLGFTQRVGGFSKRGAHRNESAS